MSDVFLSYASADRERAAAIAEFLRVGGYSVWWDRTIPPGRVFDEVLQEALGAAACIVVLWSRTSVASNWVKTEAAEGAARQILVPALLEDVPIPIEFRRIQAANLQGWTDNPDDPEFQRLMQSIGRLSHSAARGVAPRVDAHAPGSVMARTRRVTYGTIARRGWIPALVAASFLAGWLLSRTSSAPAPDSAAASPDSAAPGMVAGQPLAPNVSSGDAALKPVPPSSGSVIAGATPRKVNLLAQENGGHLVVAPSDQWRTTIDGNEGVNFVGLGEAVYAFKEDRLAAFDTFAMLIGQTDSYNVNEFELLVSREASSGSFDSIGKFHTQNLKVFAAPYQAFTFPLVEAKRLKVKLTSSHGGLCCFAWEFQLFGILAASP
jgi:hypothetical protein